MTKYEDECCGPCPMGCIGNACRNRNVPHYYCDVCGEETNEIYTNGNEDICEDCLRESIDFSEIIELLGYYRKD